MSLTAKTKRSKFGKIKNSKIKAQWLADLRSGNYKQCNGLLCEPGSKNEKASYCCLGVLGRSIQKLNAFPITFDGGRMKYKRTGSTQLPPGNLLVEVGITPVGAKHLASLNDEDELKFVDIANFIEENL